MSCYECRKNNLFIYTNPVTQYDYAIFALPGEPYSNYEKLFLPFDNLTWTYFFILFGCAFLVILIVNNFPKKFQILLYGEGVTMPSFNVVGTFFGIGQIKLPDHNFGRIILMNFIVFCLIFRTGYQGKIYRIFLLVQFIFLINFTL